MHPELRKTNVSEKRFLDILFWIDFGVYSHGRLQRSSRNYEGMLTQNTNKRI